MYERLMQKNYSTSRA